MFQMHSYIEKYQLLKRNNNNSNNSVFHLSEKKLNKVTIYCLNVTLFLFV